MSQNLNDKKCLTMFIRKSFLIKNQLNNPRLRKTVNNKRVSRKSRILFKDLKIFESKKLQLLKSHPQLFHYDLFFLVYSIQRKNFQQLGFNFPMTIFMEKQNAIFITKYKDNQMIIKDLRSNNVIYSQIFDKFFNRQIKFCNIKTKLDKFDILNKNQITFKGKNHRFFQEINNENEIYKLNFNITKQRKQIKQNAQNFIRTITFNRPQNTEDYFNVNEEQLYIKNSLNIKQSYFSYLACKVYYYLKILHQIKIKKFKIIFYINKYNFKEKPYIADFQPTNLIALQNKALYFRQFLQQNKENSIIEQKINKELLKKQFDKILIQYAHKFSKIQHQRQSYKINQINDKCEEVYQNIYQPLYRKISFKQIDFRNIQTKLNHDLNRYFRRKNSELKIQIPYKVKRLQENRKLFGRSQSLNIKKKLQ